MNYTELKKKCLFKMAKNVHGFNQMNDSTNPVKVHSEDNDTVLYKALELRQDEALLLEHRNTKEYFFITTQCLIFYNTQKGKNSVSWKGLIDVTDDTLECDWEFEEDNILPFSIEFTDTILTLQCKANAFFVMIIAIGVMSDFYPL